MMWESLREMWFLGGKKKKEEKKDLWGRFGADGDSQDGEEEFSSGHGYLFASSCASKLGRKL